jgi:MoaA/NifB/PqqE/SkfB family radical SAM enzyme/SAM-dependent methyltransferase
VNRAGEGRPQSRILFDPALWTRFEFGEIPIYVRGDKPDWFAPNRAGDRVLRELPDTPGLAEDIRVQRFLRRLPGGPPRDYAGRATILRTDHLREIWFHLTNRCNQACTHCLFASSPEKRPELPARKVLAIADQAAALGCRVFALTGGEPFVHPEFPAIVDGLLAHESSHVAVLTNGTLLRRHAKALRRWPDKAFHLQISVDGLRENHDRIRGEGAFDRLGETLGWLKGEGIPYTLSMCVVKENVCDMPGLVDLAAETGASNVHFMWYFIRGRGDAGRLPAPDRISERLIEAAERAERSGVTVDNVEAMRSQVFAPTGTIHDGNNSGWESLAVGPEGHIYPSPALIGIDALRTPLDGDLAEAWRGSPVLEELRRSSAAGLDSPLRFLLGGGDPDHSYMHGGTFAGGDPYEPVYEKTALWLITREAKRQPEEGPPRLRLKMGEVLESCGAHGSVALIHTNCLLAVAQPDSRNVVKEFYAEAAVMPRTDIRNPVCYPEDVIAHIPEAFRVRSYGCGSPVLDANLREGERVVDLGSGSGVECFIAARLVGRSSRVIGIDMLDPMLDLARKGARGVAEALGYGNTEFRKGYLEALPLEDGSVDVILSNCVVNLSSHKRRTFSEIFRVLRAGGRLVISDVVCEEEPDPALRNDDVLRGECIAGALTQRDLFGLLEETGFVTTRVLKRFPYRFVRGQTFFSMTFEARKPVPSDRVEVMYRGPFAGVVTFGGTLLVPGVTETLPRGEINGGGEELFLFDENGFVTNVALEGSCSCALPPEAGTGGPTETPPAEKGARPAREWAPTDPGTVCCAAETEAPARQLTDCIVCSVAETEAPARQRVDCMVCGAPLRYPDEEEVQPCSYCGNRFHANALCDNGHYVCDACHTKDGIAAIKRICLTAGETDMIALLRKIRSHPAIPVHGPEHHAMVPGIILAAYRNLGGELSPFAIETAIRRGSQVYGGYCAFLGACGAALGVGIAFSLILHANPVRPVERRIVQSVVKGVLEDIAALEAARCCQRDSWIALRKAAALSRQFLPITLRADEDLECRQQKANRECMGSSCPLSRSPGAAEGL